ncbi:MAG: efflux RND transporter permease subunit [Chloroflexota bacterium]|nr:efflux RND transporter permease subunit [Chloroflexota bacterium]
MTFLTAIALRRPTVAILAIIIVLTSGIFAYRSMQVELFPQIEFPLVTVFITYPSADPEAVVRDVTGPIERAIVGADGLETIQSNSSEGRAAIFVSYRYGTDMAAAETHVQNAVSSLTFPPSVEDPLVGRFNPEEIPVIQFGVVSERPLPEVQALVEDLLIPEIEKIEGVLRVDLDGGVERRVAVAADLARMTANGVTLEQVATALRENNVSLPAGILPSDGQIIIAKTTHSLDSVDDVRNLVIATNDGAPVRLSDVATVSFGEGRRTSITRVNGRDGVAVYVTKEAEANTLDVTTVVNDILEGGNGLPDDLEIIVVNDQGPDIKRQIDNLVREGTFGFLFAVSVVFAFMLTIRPTFIRGIFTTIRPTVVIGLSIPLSVFTGILLMFWQDMTLNFMTLGGLAISVGRVVDDSIVVLENVYRHIQGGRERWRAALEATTEVGPAIFASTMTTVVVFVPLAFIEGLVGAFFLPFALTVTFALLASLLVALTAVPVLGALLLRPGDLPEGAGDEGDIPMQETALQRLYLGILRWVLGHRAVTLLAAAVITFGSLGLLSVIPVNLFGGGGDRFLQIELSLPPSANVEQTLAETEAIEARLDGISKVYSASIGGIDFDFGTGPAGLQQARFFALLSEDAPEDISETLREELAKPGQTVRVSELSAGPPAGGVEIFVTGPNYDDIAEVTRELADSIGAIDGIVNMESNVTQARPELAVQVDPEKAANIGLTTEQVGTQLNKFLIGEQVTSIDIDGESVDVYLSGDLFAAGGAQGLGALQIVGPGGSASLLELATPELREGPVTISRTDGQRSASITADIVAEDTQAVGVLVDEQITALDLPPGVNVESGGIFADIAEGFQAIFISMAVGIVLVYLVMVASLGSLRNSFVIVLTLPLALVGVMASLAITDRALGLAAMMGILLLIGIVVTNAIVLISFVEQQRARGLAVYDALISGARVRLRPILMTAITTSFALLPLAVESEGGGIISAELATVVIGGLTSSTVLTLLVLPIVYMLFNDTFPRLAGRILRRAPTASPSMAAPEPAADG